MPRATHDPTTSRRHILMALSGTAVAGGALFIAIPTGVLAVPTIEPSADAELIAMIDRFDAIERQIWCAPGPDAIAEKEARDIANQPLADEQKALLDLICSTPTYTSEGLRARARSLLAWDAGAQFGERSEVSDFPDDRMTAAILHGLAGEVRV